MRMAPALILATALYVPTLAHAADPPPTATSSERRLTPEQVQQVLDEAARKREGAGGSADLESSESDVAPMPVHGEIGFSIGTGGYRSAYGTAVVDLPSGGAATISLGTHRLPQDYFFYPYR